MFFFLQHFLTVNYERLVSIRGFARLFKPDLLPFFEGPQNLPKNLLGVQTDFDAALVKSLKPLRCLEFMKSTDNHIESLEKQVTRIKAPDVYLYTAMPI